jgi:hypothetical protein
MSSRIETQPQAEAWTQGGEAGVLAYVPKDQEEHWSRHIELVVCLGKAHGAGRAALCKIMNSSAQAEMLSTCNL